MDDSAWHPSLNRRRSHRPILRISPAAGRGVPGNACLPGGSSPVVAGVPAAHMSARGSIVSHLQRSVQHGVKWCINTYDDATSPNRENGVAELEIFCGTDREGNHDPVEANAGMTLLQVRKF